VLLFAACYNRRVRQLARAQVRRFGTDGGGRGEIPQAAGKPSHITRNTPTNCLLPIANKGEVLRPVFGRFRSTMSKVYPFFHSFHSFILSFFHFPLLSFFLSVCLSSFFFLISPCRNTGQMKGG
jgi:hypothetical protein